jgi:uncharacterized protein YbjQ (UPF0145 family)
MLQSLFGGNITIYTELCETRETGLPRNDHPCRSRGANAIIGVRYDANEIMNGITEVLCYGTAVKIEKE